jgi:hypothetical protein
MQSKRTHAQHLRLVEKREETDNAGPDFDIKGDLARNDSAKHALTEGTALRGGLKDLVTDRGVLRGSNQESRHHKRSGN